MCLDLFSCTGFDPMKREPWLSLLMWMGPTSMSSLLSKDFIQTACQIQSDKAIYLASVLDRATVFCARDCQRNMALAIMKKKPVWDLRLILSDAQSESMKAIKPLLDPPS